MRDIIQDEEMFFEELEQKKRNMLGSVSNAQSELDKIEKEKNNILENIEDYNKLKKNAEVEFDVFFDRTQLLKDELQKKEIEFNLLDKKVNDAKDEYEILTRTNDLIFNNAKKELEALNSDFIEEKKEKKEKIKLINLELDKLEEEKQKICKELEEKAKQNNDLTIYIGKRMQESKELDNLIEIKNRELNKNDQLALSKFNNKPEKRLNELTKENIELKSKLSI